MTIFRRILTVLFLAFLGFSTQAQQLDHVLGDVLLRLSPDANPTELTQRLSHFKGEKTYFRVEKQIAPQLNIWQFQFDFTKVHEQHFLQFLWRQPEVEVAQLNHLLTKRETIPDDPEFGTQWHWMNTGQSGGLEDADVDAELAWDITTGGLTADGDTIVVAVVDDGIDLTHPDLVNNLWFNHAEIPNNGIDDDDNGYIDDYQGWNEGPGNDNVGTGAHGVQVSGMIGGVGNNAGQGTGINWNVKIMTIIYESADEAAVIGAYSYALGFRQLYNETNGEEGAFVVATNSSWGLDGGDPEDAPLWCAFYDTLGTHGILNCGATANVNWDIDIEGDLPTACPSDFMISVTATNSSDLRTFSAYGLEHVDFGAPGEDVYTTTSGGGYGFTSGTSFASPLTAGIIALMYSAPCSNIAALAKADPREAALQIRQYLFEGVDPVEQLDGETVTGGRVNAYNSLQLLLANCGPCPKPAAVQAEGVTDEVAAITWVATDSVLSVNFRWRAVGSADWIEIPEATSPQLLTDLLACTEYEVELEGICADTTSGYTNTYVFTTDGCCVAPDDLTIVEYSDESVILGWSSILAANQYSIQYKPVEEDDWASVLLEDLGENQVTIGSLMECTEYEVQIQSVCDTGFTAFTSSIFFTTFGCGACTDLMYCESEASIFDSEWIAGVQIGDFENLSANENGGYSDFTHLSTTLAIYGEYPVTLTPGFSDFPFPEYFKIWIDYNQNGIFDEPEELAFDAGMESEDPATGVITVPETALAGFTRMRVTMKWLGGFGEPPMPCEAELEYGEVEDYCVTIITEGEGVPCVISPELDTVSVGFTGASFEWETVNNAIAFNIRYKPVADQVEWEEFSIIDPMYDAIDLTECTPYEYQVKTICPSDTSEYSPSFFFTTRCAPNALEILEEQLNLSVYPNPFNDQLYVNMNLTEGQELQVEILNTVGQTIVGRDIGYQRTGLLQLQLKLPDNLSSGIYFIKIITEDGAISRKVIRE